MLSALSQLVHVEWTQTASTDAYSLLPSDADPLLKGETEGDVGLELEGDEPTAASGAARQRRRRPLFIWVLAILGFLFFTIIVVFGGLLLFAQEPAPEAETYPPPAAPPTNGTIDADDIDTSPETVARGTVDALFARQSKTLAEAEARYTLRTHRTPPPGFDKFFEFASSHSCLLDEYEHVDRDFQPFYDLAEKDPGYFRRMVKKAVDIGIENGDNRLTVYQLHSNGGSKMDSKYSPFGDDWGVVLRKFAGYPPPDTEVVFNFQDEPRVIFNPRLLGAVEDALNLTDDTPFDHKPHPTATYFGTEGRTRCLVRNKNTGFTGIVNDVNAFILESPSSGFTTDLFPILSQTKIDGCFSDILIPSSYYYQRSTWSPKYDYRDNIPWENKAEKLYWRGGTSGGMIEGENYHAFPRFRFIDMAENNTDIMDAFFTVLAFDNCRDGCKGDEIRDRYKTIGKMATKMDAYQFKYLFDVDGNTFSGRYLGLMRTNSLVFKSTIFTEFFDTWIKPFEHYIPVLPDLSDLVEKVQWAIANDEEAHRIQLAGREMARRVMTDAQNDCYFFAVLMEYARLQQQL